MGKPKKEISVFTFINSLVHDIVFFFNLMKYNLYQLNGNSVELIPYENIPRSVEARLDIIENSIIELYLQAQEGSVGIKKLGKR